MAAACCQRSRVEQTLDLQPAAWTAWLVPAHQLLPLPAQAFLEELVRVAGAEAGR